MEWKIARFTGMAWGEIQNDIFEAENRITVLQIIGQN